MKRIVFSQYSKVDPFRNSSNQTKTDQFEKYYRRLYKAQYDYAERCNADYECLKPDITYYPDLQFEKIYQMERYAEEYDQILYLDLDVVPSEDAPNIFNVYDTSNICMHPLRRDLTTKERKLMIEYDGFDNQSVFCKTAAKKAMLLLDDVSGNDLLYNTGVTLAGSEVMKQLNYTERKPQLDKLLDEAIEDSIYPEDITKHFFYNNEVYMSYLVERYDIPHIDLPQSWNYILDGYQRWVTHRQVGMVNNHDIAHMVHHVNKEFDLSFG